MLYQVLASTAGPGVMCRYRQYRVLNCTWCARNSTLLRCALFEEVLVPPGVMICCLSAQLSLDCLLLLSLSLPPLLLLVLLLLQSL